MAAKQKQLSTAENHIFRSLSGISGAIATRTPPYLCKISAKYVQQFGKRCIPDRQTDRQTDRHTNNKLSIPPLPWDI